MPLDLSPSLNKNVILQIMKAKYNDSISNLSNVILSKHLILFYSFYFHYHWLPTETFDFGGSQKLLLVLKY